MEISQEQRKPPDLLLCKSCFRSCQSIKEFLLHKCSCVQYPHNCDLCDKNITSKIELEVHYQCWHNIASRSKNPNRFSTSTDGNALYTSNPVSKIKPKSTHVPKIPKPSSAPAVKDTGKETENNVQGQSFSNSNQASTCTASLVCAAELTSHTKQDSQDGENEKSGFEASQDIVGALHGVAAALQPITDSTDTKTVSSPETLRIIGVLKNVATALQPLLKANPAVKPGKGKDVIMADDKPVKDAVDELHHLYRLLENGLRYVIVNDRDMWEKHLPFTFTSLTLTVNNKLEFIAKPEQKDVILKVRYSPKSPTEMGSSGARKLPLPPLKGKSKDAKCLPMAQKSNKPLSMVPVSMAGGGKPHLPAGMVFVQCQEPIDLEHMHNVLPQGIPLVRLPGLVHHTQKSTNAVSPKTAGKVAMMPATSQQVILATPLTSTSTAAGATKTSPLAGHQRVPTPVVFVPSTMTLSGCSVVGKPVDSHAVGNNVTKKSELSQMLESGTVANSAPVKSSSHSPPTATTTVATPPTITNGKTAPVTQLANSPVKVVLSTLARTPITIPLPQHATNNSVMAADSVKERTVPSDHKSDNQTLSRDLKEEPLKKRKIQEDSSCNSPANKYQKVENIEDKVKTEPIISKSSESSSKGEIIQVVVDQTMPTSPTNLCTTNNSEERDMDRYTESGNAEVITTQSQNGKTSCQGHHNTSKAMKDGQRRDGTTSPIKDSVTVTRTGQKVGDCKQLSHVTAKSSIHTSEHLKIHDDTIPDIASQRKGESSDEIICQGCKTSLPILSEHYPGTKHVHRVEFGDLRAPYKCEECVYETSDDLMTFTHHYAQHHGGFVCPQCGIMCVDANSLTNHITGNHLRRVVEV
ncbi:uncharacterized protein LOC144437367 [Glandiceps talaboti]